MKRINLIPPEAKKIQPKKWLKGYFLKSRASRFVSITLLIFILLTLWQMSFFLRYKWALVQGNKNIAKLQARLVQSQDAFAQLKAQRQEIDKETKRVEDRIKVLQQGMKERLAWAKIMTHLSTLIPPELWINKVTLNEQLVTLVGTTFDNAIVSRFMSGLDSSEYFQDTNFNYTQKTKLTDRPVINFEVTTHAVLEKILR